MRSAPRTAPLRYRFFTVKTDDLAVIGLSLYRAVCGEGRGAARTAARGEDNALARHGSRHVVPSSASPDRRPLIAARVTAAGSSITLSSAPEVERQTRSVVRLIND